MHNYRYILCVIAIFFSFLCAEGMTGDEKQTPIEIASNAYAHAPTTITMQERLVWAVDAYSFASIPINLQPYTSCHTDPHSVIILVDKIVNNTRIFFISYETQCIYRGKNLPLLKIKAQIIIDQTSSIQRIISIKES